MDRTSHASATVAGARPLDRDSLRDRYRQVRQFTEALCRPLTPEDCVVQSMPDASPAKWHLAHTTWYFETFVMQAGLRDFRPFHPRYAYLFNSYYNAVGDRHPRPQRGLLTRPTLDEVYEYRRAVDRRLLDSLDVLPDATLPVLELGLHHEQQHQELLLTDIKHLFWCNPLRPAYSERPRGSAVASSGDSCRTMEWLSVPEGVCSIGHAGGEFAFDNESPRHKVYLQSFELGSRLVTCGEYLQFIEDGGYRRPELWLSDGWDTVHRHGWEAPLYWERQADGWRLFTLSGMRPVDPAEPVCHVSLYEADAFARWSGARLPTEAEWEVVAANVPPHGNFVESGRLHPAPNVVRISESHSTTRGVVPLSLRSDPDTQRLSGQPLNPHPLFGDVWEWTASPYVAYPGYKPAEGALGEYNGKFMCNQMVLRGGSCATPGSHIRATYRNFFKPEARWQFSGIRLARSD